MEIPREMLEAERDRLAALRDQKFSELCETTGALRQVEMILAYQPDHPDPERNDEEPKP